MAEYRDTHTAQIRACVYIFLRFTFHVYLKFHLYLDKWENKRMMGETGKFVLTGFYRGKIRRAIHTNGLYHKVWLIWQWIFS